MRNSILSAFIISLITATSSAHASVEAAKVNDQVITVDQVNARITEQAHGGNISIPGKKIILDDLIKRAAAIQEAKKMKLDQDPIIQERINNVLYYALLEKKVGAEFDKLTLSDAEAKNYYDKNPEIRTSHIFIALPPGATDEDAQKATDKLKEILADIKSGKTSFAEAAQKNSEDPSSAMGGDLDYRMKDRLDPAYYRAALRMGKIGEISGPVRTSYGVHLIRLTGKHTWHETDRAHVKRIILEEKRVELTNRFLNDLRQKAKVSINEKALN